MDFLILMMTESVNRRYFIFRGILIALTTVFLSFLSLNHSHAQEAIRGTVFSGSFDNKATITVNNPDEEFPVEKLSLSLISEPQWITNIRVTADGSEALEPKASRVYTINFDVRDDAPAGATETVTFEVSAEGGMVEDPNPQIIVKIDKSTDVADTETATGEPILGDTAKREYYIVRVSGKGYIPHFRGGSYIKQGFTDIRVEVDPDAGITIESEIERIRGESSKPPNCARTIIDRLALSEGPPRFWTDGPKVTLKAGPLSAREADEQPPEEEWNTLEGDGPGFCELLEMFCGEDCAGSDSPTAEGERAEPVNPDELDPDTEPEVAGAIQEWLSTAEPPQNAVPGNRFYYDRFGRMMGSGGGMRTVGAHETVDYGTGATPEAKVWSELRTKLDSVNHCTLEEFVVARLEGRSIAHCRGRYTSVKPLKGKSLKEAKDEVTKTGLKYEVDAGSAADKKESEDTVERQEPGPDKHLKRGQTLKLVVYGPYVPPMVAVPRVTNMKFDDAAAALEGKGFETERTEVSNTLSEEKNFTVKTQEPAANKKAEKGSAVKLEVYGRYSYFKDALTALEACSKEKANEYVTKMPQGEEKAEIDKKYKELAAHLKEIESGKEDAREKFGTDCFAGAIDTLDGLLSSARCPGERETIEGIISEYERKSKTQRDELKALTDKARGEYERECFDEALASLGEALGSTRCEESRQKINKLVEKVGADKERRAAEVNSMTRQAMAQFEKGCYSDALNVMNKVLGNVRCESSRKKAEELIAKIETKRAVTANRMDEALQNFEQGCFDDAETVLNSMREEIKCEAIVAKIDALIEKVRGKRAGLNRKLREASSKFESGCYDEAESILQGVAAEVRCEKSRVKINGWLAQCKERKDALRSEMNTAMNKYEAGDYDRAKNILEGVLSKPLCEPQRTKVEGLIARMTSPPPVRESPLMPDLGGMHVDDAANAVRNLGMTPNVRKDKAPDRRNDEHRVYAQNPSPNTPIQSGATADIYSYGSFVIEEPVEPEIYFAGSWSGTAHFQQVNYILNFSIDRGNNARGTITHEQDTVNLNGSVNGSSLSMSGQIQSIKLELRGSLAGSNAQGEFFMTTQDVKCRIRSSSEAEANNCPLTTYEGSWTATKR